MALTELHLISASAAVGRPADCDLVFRLERAKELPDFSQVYPWAGNPISALRDRTMVHWLFTHPPAQGQLRSMTSSINAALEKETRRLEGGSEDDTPPRPVRVGVTCRNGTQLSPCFVEKLFQHYETSTQWTSLVVRRFHRDAFTGTWGRNKDFVWQQKTVPVQHLEDVRQIAFDDMWLVFPSSVNAAIESAFTQDPFCFNFKHENYSFDFDAGTVYNELHRNSYQLRCSVSLSDSQVNCWYLGDLGYKTCTGGYKAAGILPYSVHPVSGEAIFLLGKITYSWGWCDFGGLKSFREKPRFTAARECWEETCGILGSIRDLAASLRDFATNNAFKVVNMDTRYVGHFLRVPYQDYPTIFEPRLLEVKAKGKSIEVSEIRWVPLSSIRTAVREVLLGQKQRVSVIPLESNKRTRPIPLRREFADSLCIADKLGFLDSIEQIAKETHLASRGEQPRDKATVPPFTHQTPEPEHCSSDSHSHLLEPADLDSSSSDSSHCTSPTHLPRPHPPNEQTCDSVQALEEHKVKYHEELSGEHQAKPLVGAATSDGLTRTERELDALIAKLQGTSLTTSHPEASPRAAVSTTDQTISTADGSLQCEAGKQSERSRASSDDDRVPSEESERVVTTDRQPREGRRGKHSRGTKGRGGHKQLKSQSRLRYYGMGAGRVAVAERVFPYAY